MGGLWSHKLFILGVAALFCYEIAEISINSFFINYVVDDGWMNARDASVVLSFGGLGLFMCGRFAGSWIMQRICAEKVLLFCTICTVITSLLLVLNLGMVSLIALFLGYAFEAIIVSYSFLSLSLRRIGETYEARFLIFDDVTCRWGGRPVNDGICSRSNYDVFLFYSAFTLFYGSYVVCLESECGKIILSFYQEPLYII